MQALPEQSFQRVLLTGGSGFIGSHLMQRWMVGQPRPFRALMRRPVTSGTKAAGPDLVRGDLLEPASLVPALTGCDAVVHLAHGSDTSAVTATENLLQAAQQAGVKRFIHISSIAVHGPAPEQAAADAATPIRSDWEDSYCRAKAEEELLVRDFFDRGRLQGLVLRPTVVYGPRSPFVLQIANDARLGQVTVIDGGRGRCNALYVSDLCEAIDAALNLQEPASTALTIAADPPLPTWGEFIRSFASAVNPAASYRELSLGDALALAEQYRLDRLHRPRGVMSLPGRVTRRLLRAMGVNSGSPGYTVISHGRIARETMRATFDNQRARAALNWAPVTDFSAGVALTTAWLRESNLTA